MRLRDEFATGLPGVYPDENQGNDFWGLPKSFLSLL